MKVTFHHTEPLSVGQEVRVNNKKAKVLTTKTISVFESEIEVEGDPVVVPPSKEEVPIVLPKLPFNKITLPTG